MTIQFKKFLVGLVAAFLGILVFNLLALFAIPKSAELGIILFFGAYSLISIVAIFIFYTIFNRILLRAQEETNQAVSRNHVSYKIMTAIGMIVVMLFILLFFTPLRSFLPKNCPVQKTTRAKNINTGETKEFPTPCDINLPWIIISG